MSESVLTSDEWAKREFCANDGAQRTEFAVGPDGVVGIGADAVDVWLSLNQPADALVTLPKVAALCLAGHPLGFARVDVQMARALQNNWTIDFGEMQAWAKSLADRIEALLPPEDV